MGPQSKSRTGQDLVTFPVPGKAKARERRLIPIDVEHQETCGSPGLRAKRDAVARTPQSRQTVDQAQFRHKPFGYLGNSHATSKPVNSGYLRCKVEFRKAVGLRQDGQGLIGHEYLGVVGRQYLLFAKRVNRTYRFGRKGESVNFPKMGLKVNRSRANVVLMV